jgi:hypothetical protein
MGNEKMRLLKDCCISGMEGDTEEYVCNIDTPSWKIQARRIM